MLRSVIYVRFLVVQGHLSCDQRVFRVGLGFSRLQSIWCFCDRCYETALHGFNVFDSHNR